ncbi:MAG TPA: hypothetical protein PKZ83_00350 [bacterium]|mgnify:CR=1 FL=1|nr:hypothetical protein [bacterium]HQJ63690.1 hypothetical protein [bacterium]
MFSSFDAFRILIAGKPLYLILALLLAAGISLLVYRRTRPAVRPSLRLLLAALRTAALLLILLALFEMTLQSRRVVTTPPLLAVAIDASASMQQQEAGTSRAAMLQRILAEEFNRHLDKSLNLGYYAFDAHLQELTSKAVDSLAFDGDATDISNSLASIKNRLVERNLCGILLLSDGNYTQGGDPGRYAAEIGVPVHVLGFGSAERQSDIGITQVEASPFAFAGESTPLRVTVHSTSVGQEKIGLQLEGVGGEATRAEIMLRRGPLDSTIVLKYTPTREGRQKLEVRLTPAGRDAQRANNRFTLYQDVLKSKALIFILAGSLSPDLSLLRNHLRADERFDIRLLAELGDPGGLQTGSYQALQDSIDQGDLFVLYNFPRRTSPPRSVALLQSALAKRPRPVLFISGRDPDWQRLKALEPYLPIRAEATTVAEMEVTATLTPAGQEHPVMQIPGATIAAWSLLPPVYVRDELRAWWPDAEILARARIGSPADLAGIETPQWPFILVRTSGAKSAAIIGYDLWRWHLMMVGIGNGDETYHHFFQNLVRWLQIEKNSDLVRVRSDQSTYHFGDEVRLTAQVVDARFQPVDDAEVEVTVQPTGGEKPAGGDEPRRAAAASKQSTLFLTPAGQGSYTAAFRPNQAGDYQVKAEVRRNSQKVGEATHLFTVGSYNEELSDVALKAELLRRIAALSGGFYAPADSAAGLLARIHGASLHHTRTRDLELWNRGTLLAAILALLAGEWFIRRRKGML